MELEIITEKESSPFRHIFLTDDTDGRRYDSAYMRSVIKELLARLGLSRNINTLEIGSGDNPAPSKTLLDFGAKPATLDEWHSYHTRVPTVEDLDRLGEAQLYPSLAGGKKGIMRYLGDVAFIRHKRSQLKDKRFDLLFYWGSIHSGGFCSSIQQSRTARNKFKRNIPLQDRLAAPIPNVNNNGLMAYVSGFFNRTGDPDVNPNSIPGMNGCMIDVLLLWANHKRRKPARTIVFGLNPDFAFDYIKKIILRRPFVASRQYAEEQIKKTIEQIKEAVDNNIIENFMANYWSMFSDKEAKDNSAYKKALKVFTPAQQKAISNLGLIDCIAVQYDK